MKCPKCGGYVKKEPLGIAVFWCKCLICGWDDWPRIDPLTLKHIRTRHPERAR